MDWEKEFKEIEKVEGDRYVNLSKDDLKLKKSIYEDKFFENSKDIEYFEEQIKQKSRENYLLKIELELIKRRVKENEKN